MCLNECLRTVARSKICLHYIFAMFICLNLYWMLNNDASTEFSPVIHYQPYAEDDISCHIVEDAALPTINTTITTDKRIFFLETSCKGGIGSRQACAIESAAIANPNWRIEVLFLGPVTSMFLKGSIYKSLNKIDNVVFSRENFIDFTKNSPIDTLVLTDFIHMSKTRKVQHTSDMLRFVTLYKYGGVYLDLDVVVVKSFDTLVHNWIAKQEPDELGAGALGYSNDEVGRKIANLTIYHFVRTFNPFLWDDSSVGVLERMLQEICHTELVTAMTAEICSGIELYDPLYFYPITYKKWEQYLDPLPLTLKDTYSTYTHHTWNALSYKSSIPQHSKYAKLAKMFCPTIYGLYKNEFGT